VCGGGRGIRNEQEHDKRLENTTHPLPAIASTPTVFSGLLMVLSLQIMLAAEKGEFTGSLVDCEAGKVDSRASLGHKPVSC